MSGQSPSDGLDDRLEVLDPPSCLELLGGLPVARLAWVGPGGRVEVRPVNVVLDGDDVLMRLREGPMLDAVRSGTALTLQADRIEPAVRGGWSVLVFGTGDVVGSGDGRAAGVTPWAGGDTHLVRLRPTEITGRRLRLTVGSVTAIRLGGDEDGDGDEDLRGARSSPPPPP